jgi:hypothetical protein
VKLSFVDKLAAFRAIGKVKGDYAAGAEIMRLRDSDFIDPKQVRNYIGMLNRVDETNLWTAVCEASSWLSHAIVRDGEVGIPKSGILSLVPVVVMDGVSSQAIRFISQNLHQFKSTRSQLLMYKLIVTNGVLKWVGGKLADRIAEISSTDDVLPGVEATLISRLTDSSTVDGDDIDTVIVRRFVDHAIKL